MSATPPPRSGGTEGLDEGPLEAPESVVLEVVDGPSKGLKVSLTAPTVFVGKSRACDVVVDDPTVSSRHLRVERLRGAVRVHDQGSRNGTFYLSARISEALVPVGGSVRIGRTTLRFSGPAGATPLSTREELCGLIGRSPQMRRVFADLERLGPEDVTVLLVGETGTGKEAAARALHTLSGRKEAPFVVFDCASASPQLVETELFGHVKGAFTGASSARTGAVASAEGGTLFLDSVGDLPVELQPKLLRLLEAREYRPVGGNAPLRTDIRVIASTRRPLEPLVRQNAFREDLFFRLAVTELRLPPLRQRVEDVPVLAARFAQELTGSTVTLSANTLAALQCDPWPGNVRELRNAVQRVVTLGAAHPQAQARAAETVGGTDASPNFKQARQAMLEQFEKDFLVSLLAKHKGNVSAAARDSGLSRRQLYRLLTQHQIPYRESD